MIVCLSFGFSASCFSQLPMAAVLAKGDITLKGSQVSFSSFDSSDPAHDDPFDSAEITANGGLASLHGVINIGNNGVHGKIRTGLEGACVIGPRGFVGPMAWEGPGIYSSAWLETRNSPDFLNVGIYFFGALTPQGEGTNHWVLSGANDYFVEGDVELNNKVILVTGGLVRLHVTGNFRMLGNSTIKINPGAMLRLYVGQVGGPEVSTVLDHVNHSGAAAAFQYLGLPSNKSVSWTGKDILSGTIYAPQATLTMNGGGAATSHFIGACMVNEAIFNGHLHCHYDENLRRGGQ